MNHVGIIVTVAEHPNMYTTLNRCELAIISCHIPIFSQCLVQHVQHAPNFLMYEFRPQSRIGSAAHILVQASGLGVGLGTGLIVRVLLVVGSATAAAAKTARRILESFMGALYGKVESYGLRHGSNLICR